MMKRRRRNLATVDPKGRFDVLLYRVAERGLAQIEQETRIEGLAGRVLPLVESVICQYVPARNRLPQEIIELWQFIEANRREIPQAKPMGKAGAA